MVMYVKALFKLQNILQIWSIVTTIMIMHYPYVGVQSLILNNMQPSHLVLHAPATSSKLHSLEKRADSLTKPKWKIKMNKNSHTPKRAKARAAWRKKPSNCLHTPACFHMLAFKEAQLLGSSQLHRIKKMHPKCLDGCSRQEPTRMKVHKQG